MPVYKLFTPCCIILTYISVMREGTSTLTFPENVLTMILLLFFFFFG